MNCEVFERRLHEILDDRKAPEGDRSLRAHAESCDNCRQILVAQESLWAGLELFEVPELPTGFSEQVVESVFPRRRVRLPVVIAWVAAVAAVLLIALIPMLRGTKTKQDTAQPAPIEKQPIVPPKNNVPVVDEQPGANSIQTDFLATLIPETTDFVKSVGSDNMASVRPITSTFSSALTLIRRTLPGGKADEAKKSDSSSVAPIRRKRVV